MYISLVSLYTISPVAIIMFMQYRIILTVFCFSGSSTVSSKRSSPCKFNFSFPYFITVTCRASCIKLYNYEKKSLSVALSDI